MQNFHNGISNFFHSYADGNTDSNVLIVKGSQLENEDSEGLLSTVVKKLESLSNGVKIITEKESVENDVVNLEAFNEADIVLLFSKTKSVFRREVLAFLQDRICSPKILRVFDFSPELFEQAFQQTQFELDSLNKLIINAASNTSTVRVVSDAGTNLSIELQDGHEWTNSCGRFNGNFPGVVPPGEVNTFSSAINGVLVCDGAINCSIGFPGSVLQHETPLTLTIVDGQVVEYQSDSHLLSLFLKSWASIENSLRVGEVGFGTNLGSNKFVNFCSHLNERHPGLHLGLGTPTQSAKSLDWTCHAHLDVIPASTSIYFDDELVFHKQCYLEDSLRTIAGARDTRNVLDVDAI